jgi:DNA-binding transcriptional ArsR family regulator
MNPRINSDDVFKALADPTRRALFERLSREGELTVHRLTEHSGVSQPAVSKHLGQLKEAGLVRDRRAGRETHYTAQPQALAPLIDWMSVYATFWSERIERLENLLDRMD